jgi:hypothetical protein
MKRAEQLRAWEEQRPLIEDALGCAIPPLLGERLSADQAVWCHHALWHARVYLACVHGRVGQTIPYTQAASVVGAHHAGRPVSKTIARTLKSRRPTGSVGS